MSHEITCSREARHKEKPKLFFIRISDSLTGLSLISSPIEEFGLLPGPVQARSIAAASLSRLQVGPGSHSCASKRKPKRDATTFPPPPRLVASATAAPSPARSSRRPPRPSIPPLSTRGTIRAPRSRLLLRSLFWSVPPCDCLAFPSSWAGQMLLWLL